MYAPKGERERDLRPMSRGILPEQVRVMSYPGARYLGTALHAFVMARRLKYERHPLPY